MRTNSVEIPPGFVELGSTMNTLGEQFRPIFTSLAAVPRISPALAAPLEAMRTTFAPLFPARKD